MTDPKTTLITQLQARNTELVEANRRFKERVAALEEENALMIYWGENANRMMRQHRDADPSAVCPCPKLRLEAFTALPSGLRLFLAEYRKALSKHPTFPANVDGMGCTLGEELQEVAVAGMKAMQAVNDHRDDGLPLADVRREFAHVGVVVGRGLEALDALLAQTANARSQS